MTELPLRVHPLAEVEFEAAIEYYEALETGKGVELAVVVAEAFDLLQRHPECGAPVRGRIRRLVVQPVTRWSYSIYYRVAENHIRILALAHQARQPFYWLERR